MPTASTALPLADRFRRRPFFDSPRLLRQSPRKTVKRGRKQLFDAAIFKERFRTIERVFAWKDKFRRVLNRFEVISEVHYALKTLAYTMINLRHFCRD